MANISNLTDAVYEQLNRIMEAETPDAITMECERSEAVTKLVSTAHSQVELQLKVMKMANEATDRTVEYVAKKMLGAGND